MENNIMSIVLPCYNEEEILWESSVIINDKIDYLIDKGVVSKHSFALFVDDGSTDRTWEIICKLHREFPERFKGIRLSTNCGHQVAVFAGIEVSVSRADFIISMDADLQQDIDAIEAFINKYKNGKDVVNGVRNDRKTDSLFKKFTALTYYKLLKRMGCKIITNSADYRLLSKKAALALIKYKENNLFIRGIVPAMGFSNDVVRFDVKERIGGESKYTLKKMFKLALDGITSFSIKPIRIIINMGIAILALSFLMIVYIIVSYFRNMTISGWASLAVSIWLLGGVQLVSIGVIGEYTGRTYIESKHRPRYLIDDSCIDDKENVLEELL